MKSRFFVLLPLLLIAGVYYKFTPAPLVADDWRDAPRSAVEELGVPDDYSGVPAASAPQRSELKTPAALAGDDALAMGPTPEEEARMASHNRAFKANKGFPLDSAPLNLRPFADYEPTGYLLMTGNFNFSSGDAKLAAARALGPEGILVIMVAPDELWLQKSRLLTFFSQAVPQERIKVVAIDDAYYGFWARDTIPIPMLNKDSGEFTVIDAKYFRSYASDAQVAALFGAKVESVPYFFEGGNFQANDRGDCLMVDKKGHADIPDAVFTGYYGCKRLFRLPHLEGIGHIDEHARFVSADTVVTDLEEYKPALAAAGFRVVMLPRVPGAKYSTHVNSLIIDGKVAMPAYGKGTDDQAKAVYESLGLQVIPASTSTLSESGKGSIHCVTMTYPRVPFKELLKALKGTEF